MLDLLLGAVGAGTGLLSSLLGNASKNNQVDDLMEELKKRRYSEDQISRRQNEVKRTYGNTVDSMIGSAGFLNGDTARMIANSKIATQSAQAQIKERFALEDQNKQLDFKTAELSGQKIGTAGMISSALMDTLNTGIQGYTTGSYLDMLNPTKNVTEDLTTEVLNRTVANANQPVDMTNINRDLGGFTNPQARNGVIEEQYIPRVNPPTGRIPQFDYMNQGNNIPQESFNDYSAMTDYSKSNPYWRINDVEQPNSLMNNLLRIDLMNIEDNVLSNQLPIERSNTTFLPGMSTVLRHFYDVAPKDGLYPYSNRPSQTAEERNNFLTGYRKREISKGINTPRNPNYQKFLRF